MTTIKRPIVRYHGGKWLLAPWVIAHFPKHKVYTEVFGGGANILLRKRRSYAEIYNDKWDIIVNVFKVLRNKEKAKELKRLITLTPFSRTEYASCKQILSTDDDIERARKTLACSFMGFGSASINPNYITGFRANSNRSGTTPSSDWNNYSKHIDSFVDRLKGVTIENRDYVEVLLQHDKPHTLHYVDPPYLKKTRSAKGDTYAHDFTFDDHIRLQETLNSLEGMVVLSGYDSYEYDELFCGWKKFKRMAKTDSKKKKLECLYLNAAAAKNMPQKLLF